VTQWKREIDVIVIGGGLAGYCAALEAAAANASVVLLEKQPQIAAACCRADSLRSPAPICRRPRYRR
jgi:succinate dehydrogenase/fumarate reductase flavoprotein subunit